MIEFWIGVLGGILLLPLAAIIAFIITPKEALIKYTIDKLEERIKNRQ